MRGPSTGCTTAGSCRSSIASRRRTRWCGPRRPARCTPGHTSSTPSVTSPIGVSRSGRTRNFGGRATRLSRCACQSLRALSVQNSATRADRSPMPRPTLLTADQVTLAGRRWFAEDTPTASVVLVHGFCASSDDPAVVNVAESLSAQGFDVVSYDARGHGRSAGESTLGDLEEHDVAAAVALARERTSDVVLVGASMGAIAALRYAATDPELRGIVSVSCPGSMDVADQPRGSSGRRHDPHALRPRLSRPHGQGASGSSLDEPHAPSRAGEPTTGTARGHPWHERSLHTRQGVVRLVRERQRRALARSGAAHGSRVRRVGHRANRPRRCLDTRRSRPRLTSCGISASGSVPPPGEADEAGTDVRHHHGVELADER